MRRAGRLPAAPVTTSIILVNLLVYVGTAIASGSLEPTMEVLERAGGNALARTSHGEWWRLLTHVFLHGGLLHIGFNMYVFYGVGRFLELVFGRFPFALLYLVAGLFGGLATWWWMSATMSVGASGAVFGCYGAFLVFLWRDRGAIPRPVLATLKRNAVFFVAFNLLFGAAMPGIDNAAHLGGLLAGAAMGLGLVHPQEEVGWPGRRRRAWLLALAALALTLPLVALGPRVADPQVWASAFDEAQTEFYAAQADAMSIEAESTADESAAAETAKRQLELYENRVLPAVDRARTALPPEREVVRALRPLWRQAQRWVDASAESTDAILKALRGQPPPPIGQEGTAR